jgi:cellulose synthase/poly-beta-1,6-N-acetylglucosamine synthase-like glycosyltransferase
VPSAAEPPPAAAGAPTAPLPTLERLGLPIPLGGTSNHFPREVLEWLGRWDPFNVTEDADLGLRLARAGLDVRMLDCETWEERRGRFC